MKHLRRGWDPESVTRWKMVCFFAAAGFWVAGVVSTIQHLTTVAILLAAAGVLLRWVPTRETGWDVRGEYEAGGEDDQRAG